MPRRRLLLALFTLLFLVAARQRGVHHPRPLPPPNDAFSYANATVVTTRHLVLDLTVDFEARQLHGTATLHIDNPTGANELLLDIDRLDIRRVVLDGTTAVQWSLGAQRDYGQALRIPIERSTQTVTIDYSTHPGARGLFWNTAEQSYGRQEPYLYSLNEPVGARSWIPIQDTPSMRMTWSATLRVPPQLLALMSAENNPTARNASGVYAFTMSKTMPAYLIALAVGRLEFHPLDERTGVYAEPELISDAAWELQYVPEMVDVAESILPPYPFARYDLLLMPPTFVVGGMEHPMLNFINPFSVVTGNRPARPEPRTLIAHELAHSWAGDLTTLANWDDVWINEGFTSYLTLRIIEEMSGRDRTELQFALDRASYSGYASQPANQYSTILHRRVITPNDGFNPTGYVKGELFLRMIEDHIGRPQLDAFLRAWFSNYTWRWVDHEMFRAALYLYTPRGIDLRLDEWLYQPGLPSNVTAPQSSVIYERALQRAVAFGSGTPIAQLAPSTWSDVEIDLFLSLVPPAPLRSRMAEVDAALGLSLRVTPPLNWLLHAAHAEYTPARPAIERALLRGGPNGWIGQIYNALLWTPANREFARDVFARARKRYHPSVEAAVSQWLTTAGSAVRDAA